jgi:hypothetical protein
VDLPTYTNIWRIEKRLYKLYDLRLPMPLPLVQIGVFVGIFLPWIILLQIAQVPFHAAGVTVYVVPPGVLTWLATRPVIEGKRLTELMISQIRYLTEAKTWARLTPIREPDEVAIVGRVWLRRRGVPGRVHAGRARKGSRQAQPAAAAVTQADQSAPPLHGAETPVRPAARAAAQPARSAEAPSRRPAAQPGRAQQRPSLRPTPHEGMPTVSPSPGAAGPAPRRSVGGPARFERPVGHARGRPARDPHRPSARAACGRPERDARRRGRPAGDACRLRRPEGDAARVDPARPASAGAAACPRLPGPSARRRYVGDRGRHGPARTAGGACAGERADGRAGRARHPAPSGAPAQHVARARAPGRTHRPAPARHPVLPTGAGTVR